MVNKEIEHSQSQSNKPRVLVVDDEVTVLRLMQINFKKAGYEVKTAANGRIALDVIAKDPDFDLVLLDIMMPDMNGYQVCRYLREKYTLYELPIIFITAKFQVHDIIEGFDIGANDYILKPFDFKELQARANTLVKLKKLTKANEVLNNARNLANNFHMMTIHDLKNPLTSILLRTEFLYGLVDDNPQIKEQIDAIKKSSQLMLDLIYDFVEMGLIDGGKVIIDKNKICLNNIVTDVIQDNKEKAKQKEQELIFEHENNKKCFINADPKKIYQIVENLISNAIKYSPLEKNILINVQYVAKSDNSAYVQFSVKDEGAGLSSEDYKTVFNKFSKLSARPTAGEPSTGLGLSIAKELVELHKGKIWVESEFELGSTFYFKIPAYSE